MTAAAPSIVGRRLDTSLRVVVGAATMGVFAAGLFAQARTWTEGRENRIDA